MSSSIVFAIFALAFPLYSFSQAYLGREYSYDDHPRTIENDWFELNFRVNSDSTVSFLRTHIRTGKKVPDAVNNAYHPETSYYSGWVRTLTDTSYRIILDDTYAITFLSEPNDQHDWCNCCDKSIDTICISFDSVRIWLPPTFRMIFEDGTDTLYNESQLFQPGVRKYFIYDSTAWQSRLCTTYLLPVNQQYQRSKFVYYDLGLKNPYTGQPILHKVLHGFHPSYKNWDAGRFNYVLVNGKSGWYIVHEIGEFYWGNQPVLLDRKE